MPEDTEAKVYVAVRIPKKVHQAILKRQKAIEREWGVPVSFSTALRTVISEGLKK